MSDYLTTLPVELIHKILDNVPSFDILSSLCFVNKRLYLVSLAYPRFQLNFSCVNTSMNKSQFDSICTQLLYLTSQIVSLTLFDEDHVITSVKNELFFSRFSIIDTTFPNLRVLNLTHIDSDTWCLFKTRFPPLIMTLSIYLSYSDTLACLQTTGSILSELLFLSPSLQRLSVKMAGFMDGDVKIRPSNSATSSSVQYFHLEYVTIDLLSLLAVAPMLHTLEASFEISDLKSGRIHPRLLYLQQLLIEVWTITWTETTTLLSSFPRLAYLAVRVNNAYSDMADGSNWTRLLQQIKHFEFKLYFYSDAFQQPFNLDSFRTKFWLEEKKWFVTYDRCLNSFQPSILYSNSSSIIIHAIYEMIGMAVSESTSLEPVSLHNVHRLIINDDHVEYPLSRRYPDVTELYLSQVSTTSSTMFKDLVARLDTLQIVTCDIGPNWSKNSSYEHIEFLHRLPHLRQLKVYAISLNYLFVHQWPHIVDLEIVDGSENNHHVLSSNDIDALCHSFTHIKRLDIHSSSITDLPQLINRMKTTLTDIFIGEPRKVNNKQSLTREWIERNTELQNFHYTCNGWNSVCLWL